MSKIIMDTICQSSYCIFFSFSPSLDHAPGHVPLYKVIMGDIKVQCGANFVPFRVMFVGANKFPSLV